jgi:KDO2-lipid IV(A) lauroyltransferase
VIVLFRILAWLPLPLLHGLGVVLGWLIYLAPGRHSARLRDNVAASGLDGSGRLLRRVIGESGKAIVELAPVWLRPYDRVLKLVKATPGWEQIEAARAAGRGVLVIAPHIGCFEIINQYFAATHRFTALYKPARKPALEALMLAGRQRGHAVLVPTDLSGVRALLVALRRGEAVGILPDQVASAGDGVWAPFFGRPAYTPTLAISLQRKTRAAAFFVAAERLSWGRGYVLRITPLDGDFPEDKTAAASLINRGVEDMVRRFPAQYLWSYNRYKRPGGAPPPPFA